MIRLHVEAALSSGAIVDATQAQAHYLGGVMRRSAGDAVHLFNGVDGEWLCRIATLARGKARLAVETRIRPQSSDSDVWLMFAVLKRDTTDLVVQKATELGVSALWPVFTERTNAGRVNLDRLRAIAVEAAEQSERLTVPVVHPARQLYDNLMEWPSDRTLFVARERADVPPLAARLETTQPETTQPEATHGVCPKAPIGQAGLLVGPEGGFGPGDLRLLDGYGFVRPVSLGSRILRAETAAIVGLALLQAASWG